MSSPFLHAPLYPTDRFIPPFSQPFPVLLVCLEARTVAQVQTSQSKGGEGGLFLFFFLFFAFPIHFFEKDGYQAWTKPLSYTLLHGYFNVYGGKEGKDVYSGGELEKGGGKGKSTAATLPPSLPPLPPFETKGVSTGGGGGGNEP